MTIKKFTKEGRFECGLEKIVEGKVWAFTGVLGKGDGDPPFMMGVAIANERGYAPIPPTWCYGDDYDEMCDHADELNEAEGLTLDEAARIVASTMRKGDRLISAEEEEWEAD